MTFTPTDKLLLSALLPTAPNQQRLRELLTSRPNEIDWAVAVQRSVASGTAALLRYTLARASGLAFVPQSQSDLLAQESHSWAARQQIYVAETRRLMDVFEAQGVNSLPLKGAALMLGGYYPLPGLRAAIDVDLLVAPEQAEAAFALALEAGFAEVEIKKPVRVPMPLPYELRHLPLLRNQRGVALELHYRAFHKMRQQRDFAWAEMIDRAVVREGILLPAVEDLALHLIQHSIVDLTSAYAILRTLADLHFLFAAEPDAKERLVARAADFGLRGGVSVALETLESLEAGHDENSPARVKLLLETALAGTTPGLFEAARLFEYLDLRQQPLARLKHLYRLLTAGGKSAPPSAQEQIPVSRANRGLMLLGRLNWKGVTLADLRRVMALRKITQK